MRDGFRGQEKRKADEKEHAVVRSKTLERVRKVRQ